MNKKWTLPLVILSLLVVGVGAVLVNHLSNTAEVKVDVQQPLTVAIEPAGPVTKYGGETIDINITVENLASVAINGTREIVITNNITNATCADFTSIIGMCEEDTGVVTITENINYAANASVTTPWSATLDPAVEPAEYTISVTVRPV